MRNTFVGTAMAVATVAFAGCGSTGAFVPAEKATAVSPTGYPAAEYDMDVKTADLGDARVWSEGALRMELQGEKTTAVQVGFTIENTTDQPMRINPERTKLEVGLNRQSVVNLPPTRIVGNLTIPPQDSRTIQMYFRLPKGVWPTDVNGVRVKWEVENQQVRFTQQTPFINPDPYLGQYYYSPYYDPFLYNPYWGPVNVAMYPYYPYWWY